MTTTLCEEYWRSLETIKDTNLAIRTFKGIEMLVKAYKEDMSVFIACRNADANWNKPKHKYWDYDGKKGYLCFTSEEKFKSSGLENTEFAMVRARDMISNAMDKASIKGDLFGFVFNPGCSDMTVLPIGMLFEALIKTDVELPERIVC